MKPKFKLNEKVKCPKTLYNETSGIITKIDRMFKKTYNNGEFMDGGLVLEESHFDSTRKDYKPKLVDHDTFVLSVPKETFEFWNGNVRSKQITPAHKEVYKFYGYSYTVETPKMNTSFLERSLRKFK